MIYSEKGLIDAMNTLILYATKTTTTEKCAQKIKTATGNEAIKIVNIADSKRIDISDYDQIVIGTGLYMGKIHKLIKRFINKNSEMLLSKKLHFYICGLGGGEESLPAFNNDVANDLRLHATQIKYLGNEIHYELMNPIYRFVIKQIVKSHDPKIGLLEAELVEFAKQIES